MGYSFVFNPDGRRLVGSYPEAISIWNPDTGDLILQSPVQNIRNLQFSPDGARLYARRYDAILVFDTRPAVPAEAEELLRSLTTRFTLYCDLREFLQNDRGMEPSLRDTVLRMIEGRSEAPAAVASLVEDLLVSPASGGDAYERALHRSRLIAEPRPWDMAALGRVGMGQYRLGRYAEALPTLERATALLGEPDATQLLFLTMARCRLGQASKARESLDRARVLLKDANPVRMRKQLALLSEAEALLAGKR
jgi:tetratricopeptide (TPR) repeat protein